jgi:tripartite-type tricarboxylate transporter receptor subunit TctC
MSLRPFQAALASLLLAAAFGAKAYPTKAVTIVVPAPAGGTADLVVRTLSAKLSAALGQSIVVDNRAGAGGMIASQYVASAAPDGHTILMNYTSHAINPWLMQKVPYDTATAFTPVAFLGRVPLLLAVPADGPAKTASELVNLAKAKPGELSYGSAAVGGASHLGGELFSQLTGGKLLHVGYKGGAAAAIDLATGRISMLLDSQLPLLPHVQSGRVRILGVASESPSVVFPQYEPVGKVLPGFESTAWFGLVAPAGTPAPVVARLNAEVNKLLADPEIRKQLMDRGFEPHAMNPTEWGGFMAGETKRWGELIRKAGLKAQ